MDSEGKFWLSIMGIVAGGIALIVGISAIYYASKTSALSDLIKTGVDPVAASCAVNDEYGRNPTCVALVFKK